ncbi:MAG: ATP-grasp domain-containing protein [Candidatus Omnitrophica bacterium]|nr:ATP-grasp domain-containing protein [Candidatus Omnitrophota bacterium]
MIIGFTYDLKEDYKLKEGEPSDLYAELDSRPVIGSVAAALEKNGHTVKKIGNAERLLEMRGDLGVDIVFNICEGRAISRNRESQVPVLLEMMDVPFVGSDGFTLGLTLDKIATKKMLLYEKIPTPKFFEAKSLEEMNMDHLRFPMIVKPRFEGSSKGISKDAKVDDEESLRKRVDFVVKTYKQPALVEEFISGKEFTVAIIGNEDPEVFPPVQVKIDGKLDLGDQFYTFARIHSNRLGYVCPPRIPQKLIDKMRDYALKAYRAVECRDFGRIDFRTDEDGNPYVLEINPLPSLSVDDVFMVIAKHLGITYDAMIGKVVDCALQRYGKGGSL